MASATNDGDVEFGKYFAVNSAVTMAKNTIKPPKKSCQRNRINVLYLNYYASLNLIRPKPNLLN